MKNDFWCLVCTGLLVSLVASERVVAQLAAERIYPPVVSTGTTTTVKVEGKLPDGPIDTSCNRSDVQWKTAEETGRFRVTVAEDAPPGLAWVRCHNERGASSLLPLLVTRLAVAEEQQPNDAIDEATRVDIPAMLYGRLDKRGDVDGFRVKVQGGDHLVISTTAHRLLGSPMDAVLQLVDLKGNVLAQSDDGRGLDPQLVFTPPQDAELIVRLFAFPETPNSTIGFSGDDSFLYTLTITTGPFLDHVLPLVLPAGGRERARPIGWNLASGSTLLHAPPDHSNGSTVAFLPSGTGWHLQPRSPLDAAVEFAAEDPSSFTEAASLPLLFSGSIAQPGQIDRCRFPVEKATKYYARVHARDYGMQLDSILRVVDPETGKEIARNDDAGRGQYDAALDFTAPADGRLELQVSELSGLSGFRRGYTVELAEVRPQVHVTLEADHYALKSGETTTIKVAIDRRDGFDSSLRISASDLPPGLQSEAVASPPKGDAAKSVDLELNADADVSWQGEFRIVAQELDQQEELKEPTIPVVYKLHETESISAIWLTVAEPAE